MSNIITTRFLDATIKIIDHDGKKWLTADQLGLCLGYKPANARNGISHLYNRHADELTEADTCIINLMMQGGDKTSPNPQGGNPTMRIFSETGCVKLSFFANTPRAKDFRAWAACELASRGVTPLAEPGMGIDTGAFNSMVQSMDSMARNVDKLAQGLDVVQRQLNVTGKYIGLLEVNQKGHLKVTREIEAEVFRLYREGMSQASTARNLRISASTTNLIIKGKYRFSKRIDEPTPENALQALVNGELADERAALIAEV